jgi:CHAD domain-containing protein
MVKDIAMKRHGRKPDGQAADTRPAGAQISAEQAFASYAAPLVNDAIEYANTVREDPSPEALHKLRVSLRRLRSLWWAFEPLLDKGESTRHRALYKFLAAAAGKTRDWDILIELIAGKGNVARDMAPQLEAARGDALATSRETLLNADVKHLLREALSDATKALNTAPERVPLRKFAEKRVRDSGRSLKKRMKRASRAKRSSYASFHDVRKAGKKLRYLLEFFDPVLKGRRKRTVKRLKQIQKRFGALNDIVASEMLLRDNPAALGGADEVEGVLHGLKKERKRRMRSAAGLLRKS